MAPSRLATWYYKVADFNVESLFVKKRPPGPPRTVFVNENIPDDYYDKKGRVKKEHVYATNQVITSKYSVITFLPRNLLEQFRRIANIFFLGIAILQFFSKFSTISPGLVILPLLIVLFITAAKDGYEDVKRHQSDRHVNHSHVRILSGEEWVNTNVTAPKSQEFVGGIPNPKDIRWPWHKDKQMKNPEPTENLEGVTSRDLEAPSRTATYDTGVEYDDEHTQETPQHGNENRDDDDHNHGLHLFGHHHSKRPHWKRTMWEDVRVGDFVKLMDNESFPADILICATSEDENVAFVETKNLDGETNLKSRNAVPALTHLRSAADCANKLNSFRVDCDRPDVNMYRCNAAVMVNKEKFPIDISMMLLRGTVLRNTGWVIGVVLYTGEDSKIVLNSGGTPSKRSKVERQMNPQVFINLILLAAMGIACGIVDSVLEKRQYPEGAPWLFDDNRKDDNPSINGLVTWAFALITFQNIVPISLYISIEVVRTIQAAFIYFDKAIWYDKTDQATLARSWNLSDDLGQIEYIFSDKTGTLTQNSMVFRQCSIAGKIYKGDPESLIVGEEDPLSETLRKGQTGDAKTGEIRLSSAESSTAAGSGSAVANAFDDSPAPPPHHIKKPINHFSDAILKEDLDDAVHADPGSENALHARSLNGFFSVLALCHTVLTSIDPETHAIEYKAQSPDEAALVQAAADVGFIFRGRDREILSLQTPFSEELEKYELLNILEFTSARKRMSVVLRKHDGEDSRLFLLSKGADNVIFERLRSGSEELKQTTEKHLDEFASEGLRTLTLAYKVIAEEEYADWSERYHEAVIAMDDREAKIETVSDELEHDLRLLGATAIEDRLQDGVPEAIADLKKAGLKIWVATGDKLETAIAIGHSTNLIGRESNIIVIRGGNETGRPVYQQLARAVEEFFPESGIIEDDGTVPLDLPRPSTSSVERPHPLQPLHRVNTGMSSIVGSNNGDRPGGFVLVVDGVALDQALSDETNKRVLLRLAMLCEGVICCRVSPLQKALIVHLVKDGLGVITLAIGDGANDVSMIQAADVGVGISGEEGLQAVNSSDYAIGQFRFLKRLLLVHGHWSYARNGNMILNFFYKNIVCIGVLWWFQIYDGWSSNYVFDYTYLLFWNSFWTIAPVIGIGLFDRVVDSNVLMAFPELYRYGREGRYFGIRLFVVYMLDGIYQSAIVFFLILYTYKSTSARSDGYQVGLYEFSTTMAISAVMTANLFNGLNTNVWTGWVFFAVFIGIVLIWIYTAIYSIISPGWFVTGAYGNDHFLFTSAYFWFCLPLTICLSVAPRYLAKAYRFGFAPDDISTLRYISKMDPNRDFSADSYPTGKTSGLAAMRRQPSIISRTESIGGVSSIVDPRRPSYDVRSASRTDMSTGVRSIHRGFDFSTEENGATPRQFDSELRLHLLSIMSAPPDIERGDYETYEDGDHERETLLPVTAETSKPELDSEDPPLLPIGTHPQSCCKPRFTVLHIAIAFFGGTLACLLGQYAICGSNCFNASPTTSSLSTSPADNLLAPPYVGSTEVHHFPPASPTNAFPSLFPTNVGYPGGTPTGAEPALIATAPSYPLHTGAAQLVAAKTKGKGSKNFDMFKSWGNLSPWYSVDRTAFGLDSDPGTPDTCRITGLHFLHRHGARYPTAWASYGGPANFSGRLNEAAAGWNGSGQLEFMNDWTYKLGEEVLTPFGRQQLFDLGISMRLKYGFLLKNFTESNTIPVFRTESQDRMLASALNFAIGFFGYPFKDKYQQSITIEADGFNNTLAPYDTCPNARDRSKSDRAIPYIKQWAGIYLADAHARLQPQLKGYDLSIEDVYVFQQMCAYETVAIGYSKFCELFTEEEWEGFDYALDLNFWYNSAFGSPVARVQGIGYVQELVARLTHTPIETHNSSTNSTLNDNPITFPLGQSLYVDATHEVVVLNVITALNLTNFAASGPLPGDHIPPNRSFRVSQLAPFATNVQFQLLECSSLPGQQIRIIINDGVVPLTAIKGCPKQKDGMCPVETFVAAQKEIIGQTDWLYDCHGDWTLPEGPAWNTTTGDAPKL